MVLAQDDADSPRLEEVIVTAQKREQSQQEVPLSVATVQGDKLEKQGIENLENLTAYIPNFHFTETGFSTQVRVRGIGSDNSQGFEQSVGMYVDGIYYGRAQLFRMPMMDMQRAELLRGPQSTLFGKNSIAGALNLTTARPTKDLEGHLSASHENEFNTNEYNGVISGPLSDTLRARLAVRSYEDDGYMLNSYYNTQEPHEKDEAYRLSLEWDASDNLSFYLKGESNKFDKRGRSIEITQDIPLNSGGATYAQALAALGQPALEANKDYTRQVDNVDYSNNEINNLTLVTNYDFSDLSLTLVSGWLDFNYKENCDCDDTAAELLNLALGEDYSQFSQEIRIASPQGGTFEWLGGLYYQNYEQKYNDVLTISPTNFLVSALNAGLADTGVLRDFKQDSDTWAIFGQGTWHIADRWHLTLGARYTEENKDAHKEINLFTPSTGDLVTDPFVGWLYLQAFKLESEQATLAYLPTNPVTVLPLEYSGYNVKGSRSESALTPLINVQYDITGDVMAYASWTQGFKAGGFDPRSNSVGNFAAPQGMAPASEANSKLYFEFDREKATDYEMGVKSTLAGGAGELNVALFRTDYSNLQISQFDGAVGFNVGNAKKTLVQGLELEGRWALTNNLTSNYALSLLDFDYKDFKNGNCYAGQTRDGIDLDGNGSIDTCDYTGKRGVYTPKYTVNLGLDYRHSVYRDVDFVGSLAVQYVDSQNVHVNLDPKGEIDPYTMVDLRLALENENWSLALLGKNLLDKYILSYSGNAPLSDSTFHTNTYYSFVRRPKTIAAELSYRF